MVVIVGMCHCYLSECLKLSSPLIFVLLTISMADCPCYTNIPILHAVPVVPAVSKGGTKRVPVQTDI